MTHTNTLWFVIGFSGQALFSLRFLIQWISSEINQKSVIPLAFWYFSLLGGSVLLAYAIYIQDPVFIVGQAMGLLVYTRNLMLIRRQQDTANP